MRTTSAPRSSRDTDSAKQRACLEGGAKGPNIAINGLGRIGRAALKVIGGIEELNLVAVNDLVAPDNLAYLLKYDTVYGRYDKDVVANEDALVIDGRRVPVYGEPRPGRRSRPWTAVTRVET
jgi:glyceraldehyde 3-phosphate dehydrogenase